MSKYDVVKALAKQCAANELYDAQRALDEYAAHLAAQSEWPSDEDAGEVLRKFEGTVNDGGIDYLCRRDCMFVALQSVRPPVGVVSDLVFQNLAQIAEGSMPKTAMQDLASEAYNTLRKASRHAPTKDGLLISRYLWCECCKAVTEHEKRDPDVCCKECHYIAVSEHNAPTKD